MKVFVYFNLHRKLFSIKAMEGPNKGRVIGHAASVDLSAVSFKVSQAGRARVLKEQRKNVHAGAVGFLDDFGTAEFAGQAVTYNPYKYTSFVLKASESPIHSASYARLSGRSITVR